MTRNAETGGATCPQCGGPSISGCRPYAYRDRGMIVGEGEPDRWGDPTEIYSPCPGMDRLDRREYLEKSGMGPRFRSSTLDTFDTGWGLRPSVLVSAHRVASDYAEAFRPNHEGDATTGGLLFYGEPGGGKTHLAAGVLQEVITRWILRGAFVDFTTLCADIQRTFDDPAASKAAVIDPVITAPLLVLDELGAARPTEWVLDTLYLIINGRYNANLPTIFTTNYQLEKPGAGSAATPGADRAIGGAGKVATLGPRVGSRIVSRLYEMARPVSLVGVGDYRAHKGWDGQ